MEQQQSLRYRLLDELRGLDLISMMLYHAEVVHRASGLSVAAEHLLGVPPAVGLLPADGASPL